MLNETWGTRYQDLAAALADNLPAWENLPLADPPNSTGDAFFGEPLLWGHCDDSVFAQRRARLFELYADYLASDDFSERSDIASAVEELLDDC
jgi:hypothetical protein